MSEDVEFRNLDRSEVELMLDWAADEGWNPGLHDGSAFFDTDPGGFLGLFLDGELVVTVSVVRYDAAFAFAGCYICRPDRRGQGHGLELAQAALARSNVATIGLDGVLEQVHNYERLGFVTAHHTTRFGGEPILGSAGEGSVRRLGVDDLDVITRYERVRSVFPAPRRTFLERWLTAPGSVAYGLGEPGELDGYAVIRPCRSGHKVGPLFCDSPAEAERLFAGLLRGWALVLSSSMCRTPTRRPSHSPAIFGLRPTFETARMYLGLEPALDLDRVFGITTFELG